MNKYLLALVYSALFFTACNNKENRIIEFTVENHRDSYIIINNTGSQISRFTLDINGRGNYDLNQMVGFIKKKYQGMPVAEQVWHYVSEYSRHIDMLITKNNWLYNPLLLMNSAGGSRCGFRSAVMTNLLLFMGEEARSWGLEGHVITEVLADGKWQVYDPDLGVVYFNERKEICSFDELCSKPEYITNPVKIKCISNVFDSLRATSREIAGMYASRQDNGLFDTDYQRFKKNENIAFMLPPGAQLIFPIPDKSSDAAFAFAVLKIPPGWNGTVDIPLILYNTDGNAQFIVENEKLTSTEKNFNSTDAGNSPFKYNITIKENTSGVRLSYFINPLIYCADSINHFVFQGENLDMLQVNSAVYDSLNKPGWHNNKEEELKKWELVLEGCAATNSVKVRSLDDYIKKINLLNTCGILFGFQIDSSLINNYIVTEKRFLEYDSTQWSQFDDRKFFLLSWIKMLKETSHGQHKKQIQIPEL